MAPQSSSNRLMPSAPPATMRMPSGSIRISGDGWATSRPPTHWPITVTQQALAAMYPKGGTRMGLSQRGRYPYVKANVVFGDHELPEVGLRFKGNSTFWTTTGTLKRSLKLRDLTRM